ncbi:MAG TPA: tetratricopeptide repeat protein [Xanthomonadaceae bacterium]|nr:tetratricopeptide repeat protein [Xanthomonadaceae bacterium]
MSKPSFFAELKRRNVLRAATFYAASAWLLVQIATQVFPFFDIPNWVVRWFVIAALIGFPFAMLFSWFYEWTPQGIQRESEVEPHESITHETGKKLDRWIIAVLAVAVVLLLADKFVLHRDENAATTALAPGKSIAVLPFENLSADKDNAYFATGMQDEILTRLAGIHDLKVISRTSTEQYASRPPNLKVVAEQLGVATVLEGSVQRAGDKVRINLQLIDARTDSHLWAQNYDRDLKDVFAVQSDVAEKVADALKAQLLPAESARLTNVPTQNQEAHDLYLRANAHFNRAFDQTALTASEMPQAIDLYQQALARDPQFALAAAAMARAHMAIFWFVPDHSDTRLAAAKATVDQALALQPDLGEGHLALALYWYWGHRDYAQALQQLDIVRKSLPNSATIALVSGAIERRQGHWDEAIVNFQRAAVLDPRSSYALDQLAVAFTDLRRYAEADQVYVRAVAATRDPTDELVTQALNTVLWKGDLSPLRAAVASLKPDSADYVGNNQLIFDLYWWSRDNVAARRIAETDPQDIWADCCNVSMPRRLYLAWVYQATGDTARARSIYGELRDRMQSEIVHHPNDPDLHMALAFAAAGLGLKDEAIAEGRKATTLLPVSRDEFAGPAYLGWLAQLYVRVGENDQAIDLLRQLMAIRSAGGVVSPALLKLDPIWDSLRKDPRFLKLIADAEAAQAKSNP